MTEIDLNLDAYPTLLTMYQSDAYVRGCIGPAGSAKTTGAIKIMMRYSLEQAPDHEGVRKTRWLVVRQTYQQLVSATLESFKTELSEIADIRESPPPVIRIRMTLPDNTTMQTSFELLSMDSPDSITKLLGYEITGALLDEISELPEFVVDAVVSRVGRYPPMDTAHGFGGASWSGVIMITNGPNKAHWLYKWMQKLMQTEPDAPPRNDWDQFEKISGRPFFELFRQPPALIRPTREHDPWQPNPMAENVQNLQEGWAYYFKMLSQDDSRIRAYVEGDFSDLRIGEVVFPEFKPSVHILNRSKIKLEGAIPIMMSFDFGRTPVALIGVMSKTGQLIITNEFMGEGMAISTLWDTRVKPHMNTQLSRARIVSAWGDPSGASGGQGLELSPFEVLQGEGVPIEVTWSSGNQLEPRLEAVRRRLRTLDSAGNPLLMILDTCTYLINALTTGYIYEQNKNSEQVKEVPTKSHKQWVSDLCDALQYMCLGCDTRYTNGRIVDKRIKSRKPKKQQQQKQLTHPF